MPDTGSINHKLWLARLVIFTEQAGTVLLRPLMVAGLIALLVLVGIPLGLGNWGRAAFWLVSLGLLFVTLRPVFSLRWPQLAQAVNRIETDSGLDSRPLTAVRDKLAAGEARLWAAHQARMMGRLREARWPSPRLSFARQDPYALRNLLLLALFVAVVLRGPQGLPDIAASLPQLRGGWAGLQVDGWITPPGYTGKPPVLLAKGPAPEARQAIQVPQGSSLLLRLTGASRPKLVVEERGASREIGFAEGAGGSVELRLDVTQSGTYALADGWSRIAEWTITAIPDARPEAMISGPFEINAAGVISLPYAASDDYGLRGLVLRFALADEQEDGEGIAGAGPFLAEPPQLAAAFGGANPAQARGRISGDLTKHAWAGLRVEAWLDASDGAGQHGVSGRVTLTLPERRFLRPMAQALAEQRRSLLRDSENLPAVVAALDALSVWPKGVLDGSGRYLELKAITRKLYRAEEVATLVSVSEDLWNLAVALEGNDLDAARRGLDEARRALEDALVRGAGAEEINRLVQDLKKAMEEYLAAMADAARRGELAQDPDRKPGRLVSPEELSRMLDEMQALAGKGAQDQAREMLSQLDQILKNLQMGAAGPGNPDGALMREFGKLMRGQQQLMDRTFRMPQPGDGNEGGMGQPGQGQLSDEQAALSRALGRLMDQMGERGMEVPDALGRARERMGDAGKALAAPDRSEALANQQQALNALREGFDAASRQLMDEGQGEPGSQSPDGQAAGEQDPLGRPRATRGPEFGPNEDIVPGEAAMESARRILDELRARSGAPGLAPFERDYIERLLRGLY